MLRRVEYTNQANIKKDITPVYKSSFPIDERPPVKYFFSSLERKQNHLFAYYKENMFIGFAYITLYKYICYLFFLAVKKDHRNHGYGGEILEDIKRGYSSYVILLCYEEVNEKYDNYLERVKRQGFYQSHGFKPNGLKTNEYGVIYESAYIGAHKVDYQTYVEIFVIGFGEHSRKYIKEAK